MGNWPYPTVTQLPADVSLSLHCTAHLHSLRPTNIGMQQLCPRTNNETNVTKTSFIEQQTTKKEEGGN